MKIMFTLYYAASWRPTVYNREDARTLFIYKRTYY